MRDELKEKIDDILIEYDFYHDIMSDEIMYLIDTYTEKECKEKKDESLIIINCQKCNGNPLVISGKSEWSINLIGEWEFKHNCGHTISLPSGINKNELKKGIK
jgi:hypothetical protein